MGTVAATSKVQVAIIGAGPSGLLLSQLLHVRGIDSVILERHIREHVAGRIRAGVLEQGTVELLIQARVGERMLREGLVHDGFALGIRRTQLSGGFAGASPAAACMVYGQTEITNDLMRRASPRRAELVFDASDVAIHGFRSAAPLCPLHAARSCA